MGRKQQQVKQRVVMWRHSQLDVPGQAAYSNEEADAAHSLLFLDLAVFDDMNQPEEVTVTIRPGDHLNG